MWPRSTSTLLWKLGDKLKPETRLDFEFSTKNGKNRFFRGGFDIYYFQSDIETFPIFFFGKTVEFFSSSETFLAEIFFCPKMAQKPFVRKSNNSFFFCLTSIFFHPGSRKKTDMFFLLLFDFHAFADFERSGKLLFIYCWSDLFIYCCTSLPLASTTWVRLILSCLCPLF